MQSHLYKHYMQRNYCYSMRPPTPTQRNVLSVLHVGVVGELGVTPVALTHIGLMPAGDRTSGAEPSNSQTRSFGSSHHMRTVLGVVCHLICKMKMKVIYTSKQYIKKPTASTCWHNLAFPFTGEPDGRSRFGAGSALDEQNLVKYVKGFKELNVFSGCPPLTSTRDWI